MEPRKTTNADPRESRAGFEEDYHYGYGAPPPPRRGRGPDLAALFVLLDTIRTAVPRELERQFTSLVRETLLTLRSLIDWYLERLDRGRREPEVEDIPID